MSSTASPTQQKGRSAASPVAATTSRVLIAEDDDATRLAIAFILRQQGYEVIEACDGQEAINAMVRVTPHLILLDVNMPRLDGLRVLAQVRREPVTEHVPVLILTGAATRETVRRCVALNVAGFLVKQNLDLNDLIERIGNLLVTDAGDGGAAEGSPAGSTDDGPSRVEAADASEGDDIAAFAVSDEDFAKIQRRDASWTAEQTRAVAIPLLSEEHRNRLRSLLVGEVVSDELLLSALRAEPAVVAAFCEAGTAPAAGQFDQQLLAWARGTPQTLTELIDGEARALPPAAAHGLELWHRQAVAAQAIAGRLATKLGVGDPWLDAAALLQQVGRLLYLLSPVGSDWVALSQRFEQAAMPLIMIEKQVLGLDHRQVAEQWCTSREMPAIVAATCARSDRTVASCDGEGIGPAEIVTAAAGIAAAMGLSPAGRIALQPLPQSVGERCARTWPDVASMMADLVEATGLIHMKRRLAGLRIAVAGRHVRAFALALACEGAEVHEAPDARRAGEVDAVVIERLVSNDVVAAPPSGSPPAIVLARRSDEDEMPEPAVGRLAVCLTPIVRSSFVTQVRQTIG